MKCNFGLVFAIFTTLMCSHALADVGQKLITDNDLVSYLVACNDLAKIKVVLPRGEDLTEQKLMTRKNGALMVGFVKLMEMYCPQHKRIAVIGETSNGDLWFAGQLQDGKLTGLYAAPR
jgi:hypothetical protein